MAAIDHELLLVLDSAEMGDGEPDLGAKLMRAFLKTLLESRRLPARIVCLNSGIFLTTEGSPVLDILTQYEAAGTDVRSCGTCLAYYGREDKLCVGGQGNMVGTVDAMLSFSTVLRP